MQYREFGHEVKQLAANLTQLVESVNTLQEKSAQGPLRLCTTRRTSSIPQFDVSTLLEVCGDFRTTIAECEQLLKENLSYGRERGMISPLTNVLFNTRIKGVVERFRDRLASHNRKVRLTEHGRVDLHTHFSAL